MTRNAPDLDVDVAIDMHAIEAEAANNRQFFHDRRYLESGERVGDNKFWIMKIVSNNKPLDRQEGLTYFYALEEPSNFPTEKLDNSEIEQIYLDRAVPDETGEARFKIVESHDFDDLDEFFTFAQTVESNGEETDE